MARKGSRARYTGAQAQKPGSRRKAQWGTPIRPGFRMHQFFDKETREPLYRPVRTGKRLQISVKDYNRLEGKPKIIHTKDSDVVIKDRRKGKPEQRKGEQRKEDKRKTQVGLVRNIGRHTSTGYHPSVRLTKAEFDALKDPKPSSQKWESEKGVEYEFESRRYAQRRKGDRRHTGKK